MSGSASTPIPTRFGDTQVNLASLLAQHSNDPHQALVGLVARFNSLAHQHALLVVEKETAEKAAERMSVENQALWRSLRNPRPSAVRSQSDGQPLAGGSSAPASSSSSGRAGVGAGAPPVRRGASGDTTSRLDLPPATSAQAREEQLSHLVSSASTASLRGKAATPPPLSSPRQHSISSGPSPIRKASSLDLGMGRLIPAPPDQNNSTLSTAEEPYQRSARTPPPPTRSQMEQRDRSSPRLPSSASMPSISAAERGGPSFGSRTPERRLLPAISPVSPLYSQHGGSSSGGDSPRDASPLYDSTPVTTEHGLLPPPAIERRDRDRTPSNQSVASSMGSSGGEGSQGSSAYRSNPSSFSPFGQASAREPPPALRERRPSQPTTLADLHETTDSPPPHLPPHTQHHVHRDSDTSILSQRNTAMSQSQAPPPPPHSPAPTPPAPPPPRPSLSPAFLPFTRVRVSSSGIKMNDKGKEIVTFLVDVSVSVPAEIDPERQGGVATWRVEKYYSDVLTLDSTVKSKTSRQESKSIGALPDKSLFKDHAPHKSDQRKMVLERYLQTLLALSLRDRTAICAFFNSDIVPDAAPPSSTGGMAGWLTKRGRNFGGWQTRYYVLTPGTTLAYYDTQNGTKLGEIPLVNAAIGRQSSRAADAGEDAYLHAFLIRTLNEKEQDADHILCAENDEARDAWVQALTTLQPTKPTPPPPSSSTRANGAGASFDRDRVYPSGIPMPAPTPPPTFNEERRGSGQASSRRQSASAASSSMPPQDPRNLSARLAGSDMAPSASMPANLDAIARGALPEPEKRSTSAQGHHNELRTPSKLQVASDRRRPSGDRPASPERERERHRQDSATKLVASNVSGPMNAQPLPSGYDFKKAERQKKTKSSFWNFGARGANEKLQAQPAAPSRPVFGVPLKEAVNISRIRPGLELPAVVYRCVEYLEAKNAECEEGIFRLSGSANVIRLLKERFNAEGDVNLLTSNEYYDPHAIAGLLKQYLRELPVHLLTRELHAEFIQVIDLRNRRDRVNALGRLVAQLPIEEYTLFRFFFAHLCVIAQNADVSKMNVRNLGIVFSPTLAIPAPLFTLLLAEFDLVFAVEQETGLSQPILLEEEQEVVYRARQNRNSELYSASGAALLMEGDATTRYSLREQVEEDTDDEAEAFEEDTADPPDSSYLSFPSPAPGSEHSSPSAPAPPRSPGLPLSPRPHGSFSH